MLGCHRLCFLRALGRSFLHSPGLASLAAESLRSGVFRAIPAPLWLAWPLDMSCYHAFSYSLAFLRGVGPALFGGGVSLAVEGPLKQSAVGGLIARHVHLSNSSLYGLCATLFLSVSAHVGRRVGWTYTVVRLGSGFIYALGCWVRGIVWTA